MTPQLILKICLLGLIPLQLNAADSGSKVASSTTAAVPSSRVRSQVSQSYQLSLKQLGARFPIVLRGVDGRDGVSFNVRADEVVTQARLKLFFSYSPALLTEVSHINVLVNGEVAASLALPKQASNTLQQERELDLPPRFITEYNKIDFQLIGHYTEKCEDPTHSSLWANISNLSSLEVTSEPVTLSSDLRNLPRPFMDQRDPRQLQLPFVFVGAVDNATLEAAGAVSSWFGAFAGYRGAAFPASLNTIPAKGHAIVFVTGELPLPGVVRPSAVGPSLSIVSNPNDPNGKLLLISGRDHQELRTAVNALTIGNAALEGASMLAKPLSNAALRLPYDAPNWLSSQRPVRFSELSNAAAMNVSGHSPGAIRLNLRLPPDLFAWNDPGIPVSLKYRYTPQPFKSENSSLLVNFNEQLVKSVPLLPLDSLSSWLPKLPMLTALLPDKSMSMATRLNVPMYMTAHQSQLQLNFKYDYNKEGECRDIIVDNMRGAIEPDSSIDISGYPHYLAMPNLAVFSSSGFPFTRLADLSETAVILPDSPSLQEYTTYLGLMGRMGQATGYPVSAVRVIQARQVDQFTDKDLLLIASADNQALLKKWRSYLPTQTEIKTKLKLFGLDLNPLNWAFSSAFAVEKSPANTFLEGDSRAVLIGFESPLARGRSAVLLWGAQPEDLNEALLALADGDALSSPIQGAVSVIRDKSVDSLEAESQYHLGSLPWITQVRWRLSESLPLFLALSLASAMLLAAMAYAALKRLAKRRLA